MVSSNKKSFKKVLSYIIIAILAFILASFTATKVIYDACFPRYSPVCCTEGASADTLISNWSEPVSFNSGESVLKGYHFKGTKDALIVFATGHNSCTHDYTEQIKSFLDYGWGVFIYDNMGNGLSEGDSAVGFPQSLCDLLSALDYIEKNNKLGYNELLLFGHSRGGYAVCNALASKFDIAGVVSVAGINSAMEGIIEPAERKAGFLAYVNYPFLWLYQTAIFGKEMVDANAVTAINNSSVPTLIIHGSCDQTVSKDDFSIYSHKNEITSKTAEFLLYDEPEKNGHVDILFEADGSANADLMGIINGFYNQAINNN